MILSSRLQKIIELYFLNDSITVQSLADSLKTSTRTVFRELKELESLLKVYNLTIQTKKEIQILGNSADLQRFEKEMLQNKVQYLSREDRQTLLIYEILKNRKMEKIYYYANKYQVSEATISKDLDVVEEWLEARNLQLLRRPGSSIELVKDERSYRKALALLIETNLHHNEINKNRYQADDVLSQIMNNQEESIMNLLNKEVLVKVVGVFEEYQVPLQLDKYAQNAYIGLLIHLTLAIDRILKKKEIVASKLTGELMNNKTSYEQAKQLAGYLEIAFDIEIPEQEIAYIAMHIQGAKVNVKDDFDDLEYEKELMGTILDMIEAFDITLSSDKELVNGLLVHLKPAITRIRYEMPIFNTMLKEIKKSYEQIFVRTKNACFVLENKYNIKLSEDEVGFITMHFGAAIERNKNKRVSRRVVDIGVVCASGIGVSALLSAKLKSVVDPFVYIETYGVQEAIQEEKIDFVVSTFDVSKYIDDYIQVHPLLKQEDIQKILLKIDEVRMSKKTTEVSTNQGIRQIQEITSEMLYITNQFEVFYKDSMQDVSDLLLYSVEILEADKEIKQVLLDTLVKREQIQSMVYEDLRFALIHCKSDVLSQSILKLIRIQTHDPIHFALCMFIPNHSQTHTSKMMSTISSALIEDEMFLMSMKYGSEDDIKKQLELKLKQYLQTVL